MDTLHILTERIKLNLNFLAPKGYVFEPLEIFNQADKERIFGSIQMRNRGLNRLLTFDIFPREIVKIDIFITDTIADSSMDLNRYIELKKGNSSKYTPFFILSKETLIASIDEFLNNVRFLFETSLKGVIENSEWISIPVPDPRDDY